MRDTIDKIDTADLVMSDMIYKLDLEGFYIYANERTAAFLQTPLKDLYSRSFSQFVREDWLDRVLDFYKQQLSGKKESSYFEFPIVKPNGEEAWVAQNLQVVSNGYQITELMVVARDITERVHVSNLLKSNEQKYREIIENINLGLMEVDLKGSIVYANDSFCRSTGYQLDEIKGRQAMDVFLPEGDSYRNEAIKQNDIRYTGQSSVYEMKLTQKNGKTIWMMISGAPVKNAEGEVIGSIGIHHDITERKIKELERKKLLKELETQNEALKQKQVYLKAINEFVTNLIACNDIHSVVKEIAENTIGKFGFIDCVIYLFDDQKTVLQQVSAYGAKQLSGGIKNPIAITLGKGIVGTVAQTGQSILVNDTSKDPRYIVDDAMRYSELAVPIIADNEIIGVIDTEHPDKNYYTPEHQELLSTIANLAATKIKNSIIREKKKRAELDLKDSESKLRLIIDSALDAVITIDVRGEVTEWNPQAEELFLFSKEEAVGQKLSDLIVPPALREAHVKGMRHYQNTGEQKVLNKRIEIHGCDKNGKEFPIELTIVPVQTKGQKFFSAFIRDITLRKQAEEDMRAALEKQKELNDMKSSFVSMTSHEFRTPLTTIQTNIDLLSFQLENETINNRERINKNFSRISSEIKRLTDLMNDILMIGRIENGKIPFKPAPVDLKGLCEEVISQSFSNRPDGRKVELLIEGDNRQVSLDYSIYTHIITNLLSNAFKYSVGASNPVLTLKFEDSEVMIDVQDFGIGIPENDLDQLFDSFYRATNVENIQGTGLGLAIVKEFSKMHEAEINVRSKVNEGTCFSISQPILMNSNI